MNPKILIGAPVKDRAWCIPFWHDAILGQDIEVDILALVTPSEDGTQPLLEDRGVYVVRDERPGRQRFEIDGHCWGRQSTYEYMSVLRNRLLDLAEGYDYFFSLDSDIVLPEHGLQRMLAHYKPGSVLAPAVNMSQTTTAWNTMSWVNPDMPAMADRPVQHPKDGRADVIMAAMLMDAEAVSKCSWQAHSQGEDVGFSLEAHAQGVKLYWISDVRCQHLMRRID